MRIACFLSRTSRIKGIEMIKEKGKKSFIEYMIRNNWVVIKLQNKKGDD
jgi:hypothetical protein